MAFLLLPAGNPSTWTGPTGNNTYLLPGKVPTLIDAGVGVQSHLDAIDRALEGRPLALVLITHGHPDHVAGAPMIASRWPGVRIRQFGTGQDPLSPDEIIDAGDATVVTLHTPGHSPDHCCFLLGSDLFCGDLARIGGTVVIPATRGGDLAEYVRSLQRVRDLGPRRLLPGHGPIIENPTALIDGYIRHRADREAQILAALANNPLSVPEIVGVIYENLADELKRAAAESVTAHLIKLEREGRVHVTREGGVPRWSR
jgi:glyoxylase-like metal-dependent hydrolase (beta-lactamase superfamily II)